MILNNRRSFIKKASLAGMALAMGRYPVFAAEEKLDFVKLTILHTNDVHSRIEPFPMDGGRNEGKGGVAKRAALINKIRQEEKNVLLFDAGDYFQGTPYYNFFGGELEIKLMSELKYDAATLGNHDFDFGIEGLHKQLPHANFPILSGNYDFSDTILHNKVQPYKIFEKEKIKIGVFGLGIELEGLVPKALYGNTVYQDPIKSGNMWADKLKNEMDCDYVICLSHLGYKYQEDKVSDHTLAQNTENIDLIIGGHTHTFLQAPVSVQNKTGKTVLINQAGFAGIMLGRVDILFERNRKGRCLTCENITVG
jgi:5'-nucleotidase